MTVNYTADRWDDKPFHSTSYLSLPVIFYSLTLKMVYITNANEKCGCAWH